MQNQIQIYTIAKKHTHLKKQYEGEELAAVITEQEPELTEPEVEAVIELIEVIAEETGAAAAAEPESSTPAAPAENQGEIIAMPEDGICPDGFSPDDDGENCVKVVDGGESENADVMPVGEDGSCMPGYKLSEDGTACILEDVTPEAEMILVKLQSNTKFTKLDYNQKQKTIRAAYKRENIAPCGCKYLKGHKNYKVPTAKPYKLTHNFEWGIPMELNKEEFEAMMLVKGVAMTSGEAKRGEMMSKDNVTFGAGAMSTAAMFGMAVCDIDHFEEKLPQEYVEKYGEKINDPYPVAVILDAAAVPFTDEVTGEEKVAVEFIASCTNPLVYSLIKDGKMKGNSVVDFYRKENCSECGESGNCKCAIDGSHFLVNTFVLEGVPNAHGTWVSPVTKDDIGTLIAAPDENMLHTLRKKMQSSAFLQSKFKYIQLAKKQHGLMVLDDYLTEEGKFTNGKAGMVEYFVDEKGLSSKMANEIADYLTEKPDVLNRDQLEFMSGEDLNAWFTHILKEENALRGSHMNKLLNTMLKRSHADLLGKESVNYRPGDGTTSCAGCRFFSPMMDFETGAMLPTGFCQIVNGDITGTDVCDRHETIQSQPSEPAAEPAAEPEPAESTLDNKTINKYSKKSKHATVPIDKQPGMNPASNRAMRQHTQKAIKKLENTPVFFAQNGARRHGEIANKIDKLKKKR